MTCTSDCVVKIVSPVLQHLTTFSGAVPVNDLAFQSDFCNFDIRSFSPQPTMIYNGFAPAPDHSWYDSLRRSLHQLEGSGITFVHRSCSQAFFDNRHIFRLLFDIGHTNDQFCYVQAAMSETWTSNSALQVALPVLQHLTTSSGAVPVNKLDSHVLPSDLLPLPARSSVFDGQVPSDKHSRGAPKLTVLPLNLSTSGLRQSSSSSGAVPRHILPESNISNHFDTLKHYLFDCRHTDTSFRYRQQHSANLWPNDKFMIQATSWPYFLSSSLQLSAVKQYGTKKVLTTAQVPQQITIFSGAVPDDNTWTHRFSLQGGLISESIFPTIPCYVNKFKEEVYVSSPSRGSTHQLTLPRHRNNVVAAPRTLLPKSDSYFSADVMLDCSLTRATSSASLPAGGSWDEDSSQTPYFCGWSQAIYSGGHPAWGKCQVVHTHPNPPFEERCAAALQDDGWLASDEALWFLRKIQEWRSGVVVGPMIQWSPSRDLRHLMATEDQLQCNNHYLTLLLFLVEAHWCAVEVDRRTSPVHVVLIQWPDEFHSMITLEISRILQIPSHRMLVTVNSDNEIVTMCGWTILHRWYLNFAMQTCLQPLIHVTEQHQDQLDRVTLRAQHHWGRTNAPAQICVVSHQCADKPFCPNTHAAALIQDCHLASLPQCLWALLKNTYGKHARYPVLRQTESEKSIGCERC